MKLNILTDTGFWIALFDPVGNLEQHDKAQSIAVWIEEHDIFIPWPTLYEFVNTRLARRPDNLMRFHQFLRKPNVQFIDDARYKDSALEKTFNQTQHKFLNYSLVDQVVREMLSDQNMKFDFFATFNESDFQDVCNYRGIEILN